jgi:hypothetical protein
MSDHTPTTEEVRRKATSNLLSLPVESFDSWLADHDRRIAEAAWDECANAIYVGTAARAAQAFNPYRLEQGHSTDAGESR